MAKTAKLINTVSQGDDHFQQHYKLSDRGNVIVSQILGSFANETYIFPADDAGLITDYIEMEGSRRGIVTPENLLIELGYEVSK